MEFQPQSSSTQNIERTYDDSRLTNILLNGKNYLPWARTITISLGGRSKLSHIEDDPPTPDDDSYKKWRAEDYLVMSWLFKAMEPEISEIFMYAENAQALWLAVHNMYSQQNNAARIFELQRELSNNKHDPNKTFTEHFGQIQKRWEELRTYRPFTTDAKELKRREEEDKVFQLLASLTDDYQELRNQILRTVPLPSVANVCTMILREETGKKAMSIKQGVESPSVFSVKRHSDNSGRGSGYTRGRGRGRGSGSSSRPLYYCDHCNKTGHSRERCWELNPHLRRDTNTEKRVAALANTSENPSQVPPISDIQTLADKFKEWLSSNNGSSTPQASVASTTHTSGQELREYDW